MFSLVLPIHNEKEALEHNIDAILYEISKFCDNYEIIIAEDGSNDGTYLLSKKLSEQNKCIKISHSKKKLGRGKALKIAFEKSKGNKVGYMDIDLATDLRHLKEMIKNLDEYDIVTGSRLIKKDLSNRTFKRYFFSFFFNILIRILLRSRIRDHQCGFKGFRRNVVKKLNEKVKDDHWFWDTEILVVAQRNKYKILEFPVEWKENIQSKVNIKRDIILMLKGILKTFYRLNF